jgi:glycosyltransferase involved in cell wall biosynthesis
VADEVVILDSHSTDQTVALATNWGAIVYQQPFAGYIEQKNAALSKVSGDWVLCLDADEVLDPALIEAILLWKAKADQDTTDGYMMHRCTNYCGKFIRHGSWYPDPKLRLFKKVSGCWAGLNPHDAIELSPGSKTATMKGDILHYSYNSLDEHIAQNNKFSTIAAQAYFKRGKKSGWFKMLLNPAWAFFHGYILMGGFRDGFYGYVIAKNVAHLTFMKYYKLYDLQKRAAQNK